MRKGYNPSLIHNSKKEIVGFALGGDACAEHECGIGDLKELCKMPRTFSRECLGLNARTSGNIPEQHYLYREWDNFAMLVVEHGAAKRYEKNVPFDLNYDIRDGISSRSGFDKSGFVSAWDEGGFAVIANKNHKDAYKGICLLRDAVKAGNISFVSLSSYKEFTGGNKGFLICGLTVVIANKLPAYVHADLKRSDEEFLSNKEEWDASGIEEELKKAGKDWFGLGNRFFRKDGNLYTWLNPYNQREYNFGWFTIAQLREWAQDRGPIIMTKKWLTK